MEKPRATIHFVTAQETGGMAQLGSVGLALARLGPSLLGLARLASAWLRLAPLGLDRRRTARVSSVWFGVLA